MEPANHGTFKAAAMRSCPGFSRRSRRGMEAYSLRRYAAMAELTEKKRDSLKESQFGLPEEKKYPMPDKSHARNAKARASQQVKKGNLTASEKQKIDRKADRVLDK
jgi:hypothetical protein